MSNSFEGRPTIAIIQARYGSSRLPGKVLLDIGGQPMLKHVVERARGIPSVDTVVVATSTANEDDSIVAYCEKEAIEVIRGHPTDCLDRYYRAVRGTTAEVVVRITGDCPVLDPEVSERTIQLLLHGWPELDFVANRLLNHRTFPVGLDTEVCKRSALEQAWANADLPHQREHVMPYLYENPERFKIQLLDADGDWGHVRLTVDTVEDLDFIRQVFESFAPRMNFGWKEILALLERKPELAQINASVRHRELEDVDRGFSAANLGGEGS
jgi:spore coat polysaccharide biosynthesis protein SpsF